MDQLAQLNVPLRAGICLDALFPYHPYDEIMADKSNFLYALGISTPWGCLRVLILQLTIPYAAYIDSELAQDASDEYPDLLPTLAGIAGVLKHLGEVECEEVDNQLTLSYQFNGKAKTLTVEILTVEIEHDYLNWELLTHICEDFKQKADQTRSYHYLDNGQLSVILFLSPKEVEQITELLELEFGLMQGLPY